MESLSHVLQSCTVSHYDRIKRYNEITRKIKRCCSKSWTVEDEPHVRHPDGTLFEPDMVVHTSPSTAVICDVEASSDGGDPMEDIWQHKKSTYLNRKFSEAATRRWPNKTLSHLPIIVGARGIWPRANEATVQALGITKAVKSSCVHSCLKWGPTVHHNFMRAVLSR